MDNTARRKRRTLRCPQCQTPLRIYRSEVAIVCDGCGQGFHRVNNRVRLIDVEFAAPSQQSETDITYRPFWVLTTEMPIVLLQPWNQPDATSGLDIYVPAYDLAWQEALDIGTRLTAWQPDYVMRDHAELRGCTVTRAEALQLAPLIYMRAVEEMGCSGSDIDVQHLPLLSSKLMAIPQQRIEEQST